MGVTRRRFLGATGATAYAVTGCLGTATGGSGRTDGGPTAQASFFVLYDFAANVAGEAMSVHNLVPFGQHGHGWEPGPDIQRDILRSEAFLYVGAGFQPWADRVVRSIREDGSDVSIIEAWREVDLLDASGGDEDHSDGGHDDHSEEDHDDHGAKDPHFWLDVERAAKSVETIAHGLSEVDPENEAVYVENAEAFTARLTDLDSTFRERLAGRTRDTVLVAGHNSFQYLGRRYGFGIEALTGIAPDATPTPRDVRRAQSIIDEHDIEYILAPVFESDRAGRQLVEETDARELLPLTPVPSLTEEWREEQWGYLDVMGNVNLTSLERALGVA